MVFHCLDMIRVPSIDAKNWSIVSQTKETVLLSNECCNPSSNDDPFACTC